MLALVSVAAAHPLDEDLVPLSAALDAYCKDFAGATGLDCDVLVDGEVDLAALLAATDERASIKLRFADARVADDYA